VSNAVEMFRILERRRQFLRLRAGQHTQCAVAHRSIRRGPASRYMPLAGRLYGNIPVCPHLSPFSPFFGRGSDVLSGTEVSASLNVLSGLADRSDALDRCALTGQVY
jgi:hypothetical protein